MQRKKGLRADGRLKRGYRYDHRGQIVKAKKKVKRRRCG
jgi:hypothetical protein